MIDDLFQIRWPIIGYVQLDTLTDQNFVYAYAKGILDAAHLERGGVDAIVVENYAEPETGALASPDSKKYMEPICSRIKEITKHAKLGINVLQADIIAAFELADKCGFDFVHADVYSDIVRSTETDNIIQVDLDHVFERRKAASHVPLLATVKPWHAYEVCSDEEIEKSASRAVEYGADAVVIVGKNGNLPEMSDIRRVKSVVQVPVGAGSGINDKTIGDYFEVADFFLVSGFFKYEGRKENPVDEKRVKQLMEVVYRKRK
jgi:hypothetical protein